jgi:hypothetical protein
MCISRLKLVGPEMGVASPSSSLTPKKPPTWPQKPFFFLFLSSFFFSLSAAAALMPFVGDEEGGTIIEPPLGTGAPGWRPIWR